MKTVLITGCSSGYDEIEWRNRGDARSNLKPLNPKQHKRRPEKIRKLTRGEQRPERDARCGSLCAEGHAEMSQKHDRVVATF